jgi:hypothetical protein
MELEKGERKAKNLINMAQLRRGSGETDEIS